MLEHISAEAQFTCVLVGDDPIKVSLSSGCSSDQTTKITPDRSAVNGRTLEVSIFVVSDTAQLKQGLLPCPS